jgi:hypothetical protein
MDSPEKCVQTSVVRLRGQFLWHGQGVVACSVMRQLKCVGYMLDVV